jgi:hypothetical protein
MGREKRQTNHHVLQARFEGAEGSWTSRNWLNFGNSWICQARHSRAVSVAGCKVEKVNQFKLAAGHRGRSLKEVA